MQPRKNKKLGKTQFTFKDTIRFNRVASEIAGGLENLKLELTALGREIKADRIGKKEFEDHLLQLNKKKTLLEARVAKNEAWAAEFDKAIGPFENTYNNLTNEISGLYDSAKEEHMKGIEVLMEQFSYHPLFKRWSDDFFAVPFKPS